MIYIYGLFDPRNLELRYIGRTLHLDARLKQHIADARHGRDRNSHKNHWIRQLLNEDLVPAMEVLEECTEDNWQESEKAWIADCKRFNVRLVNIGLGGENPPGFNDLPEYLKEQVRQRMSQTRKGRPSPNIGREWSQEYKDKMSRALSGQNNPMYGLKGENHPATGYKHTDEVRARMMGNKHLLGHVPSEETRKKIGDAHRGRVQTESDKTKKSLSQRMHHATKKGLSEAVLNLQKSYFGLFNEYHPKYPHP